MGNGLLGNVRFHFGRPFLLTHTINPQCRLAMTLKQEFPPTQLEFLLPSVSYLTRRSESQVHSDLFKQL